MTFIEQQQKKWRGEYKSRFKMFPDDEYNDTFNYYNFDAEDVLDILDTLIKTNTNDTLAEVKRVVEVLGVDHTIDCIKGRAENHNHCVRSIHHQDILTALTTIGLLDKE